jgi:hypothetical protein
MDYQLPINGQHNSLSAVILRVLGVCLDLRIPFSNHFIERTELLTCYTDMLADQKSLRAA